ncbi:MAG TPA: HypC/HybG/HupF family hydrogenase formation chaperone [Acidimicrobiales bacterium]|nr:HypC/HybG/HupF family hydrogenase formation chaperone [Acidimicrobiales bacterium]
MALRAPAATTVRWSMMCLGIPALVVEIETPTTCWVDVGGARRKVNTSVLDDAAGRRVAPGDWVLVHVGFALARLDPDEARSTLDMLESMEAVYTTELDALAGSESAGG